MDNLFAARFYDCNVVIIAGLVTRFLSFKLKGRETKVDATIHSLLLDEVRQMRRGGGREGGGQLNFYEEHVQATTIYPSHTDSKQLSYKRLAAFQTGLETLGLEDPKVNKPCLKLQ